LILDYILAKKQDKSRSSKEKPALKPAGLFLKTRKNIAEWIYPIKSL